MAGMKLSIKAGMDATGVVQGAATIKAAMKSIGEGVQESRQNYQSGARAMVEDNQAVAMAAVAVGAATDAVSTAAVGAAAGVAGAGQRMEDSLAGVTSAAREAANAAGKVGDGIGMPPVNDNSAEVNRLAAAVASLEAAMDPAARATHAMAARTELLNAALEAGAIDADRHASLMGRVRQAFDAADDGAARMAAAVDLLEAELDPAARAAQALAARTGMLDKALASGAISAERHAMLMGRLKGGYDAVTGAGKLTHQQSVQLGYQLNDVFTSLASGASPFMVLAQQGGQVTQIFGGVRQTLARIPPAAWAAAGAVALIVGPAVIVGNRLAEIGRETRAFQAAITALNPSLGVSAQRLREISFAVADARGLDRGAVSGGISAIIANSRIQGEAMVTGLAGIAGDVAAVKGGELTGWAEKLADAFGKGAAGVRELDEALRFLTPEQARSIEALERQGDRAGALTIAMGALEARFGGSAKAMKSEWDIAVSGIGRSWDGLLEKLATSPIVLGAADILSKSLKGWELIIDRLTQSVPEGEETAAALVRVQEQLRDALAQGAVGPAVDMLIAQIRTLQDKLWKQGQARAAGAAGTGSVTPPGTVPTVGTAPPPPTGGMTDSEIKNLDRMREALEQETKALAGNAALRQVRLARMQAENAAYAAGRGMEAAVQEGLIAERRAMLALNTSLRDQDAAASLALRSQSELTAARLQGADVAMQVEAANAAAMEALTSPINKQARARELLAASVARVAAEGADAVVTAEAEAEAEAQRRLTAAAGGTAEAKAQAELAGKVALATAPLRVAMTKAEGKALDELREIEERLTAAIIEKDAFQKEAALKEITGDQNREIAARIALIEVETKHQWATNRERVLAIAHQRAINDAIAQGIDLSSDLGKQWIENRDKLAELELDAGPLQPDPFNQSPEAAADFIAEFQVIMQEAA